jgi:hypothetical protein
MLKNRSMPEGTVIPVLYYPDITKRLIGFVVLWLHSRLRIGDHRAQLNVGDGCIVVAQGESLPSALSIMVRMHVSTALRQ